MGFKIRIHFNGPSPAEWIFQKNTTGKLETIKPSRYLIEVATGYYHPLSEIDIIVSKL